LDFRGLPAVAPAHCVRCNVAPTRSTGRHSGRRICPVAVIAHPFALRFSSSHPLIRSSREPRLSVGSPIRDLHGGNVVQPGDHEPGLAAIALFVHHAREAQLRASVGRAMLPGMLPRSAETDAFWQAFRRSRWDSRRAFRADSVDLCDIFWFFRLLADLDYAFPVFDITAS